MSRRSTPSDLTTGPGPAPGPGGVAAPQRRRDARLNRERLLAAAAAAFATGDPVSLESIAHDAGVGIGTLYRHFPNREALVEAVYRSEVRRLRESADELLQTMAPDVALRAWMDRFADWVATKRGMVETLRALTSAGTIEYSVVRDELTETIQSILDAGIGAGSLRGDVRARDLLALTTGAFLASGNDGKAQVARMLDLVRDAALTERAVPDAAVSDAAAGATATTARGGSRTRRASRR